MFQHVSTCFTGLSGFAWYPFVKVLADRLLNGAILLWTWCKWCSFRLQACDKLASGSLDLEASPLSWSVKCFCPMQWKHGRASPSLLDQAEIVVERQWIKSLLTEVRTLSPHVALFLIRQVWVVVYVLKAKCFADIVEAVEGPRHLPLPGSCGQLLRLSDCHFLTVLQCWQMLNMFQLSKWCFAETWA